MNLKRSYLNMQLNSKHILSPKHRSNELPKGLNFAASRRQENDGRH
jgi:hypothetical protein